MPEKMKERMVTITQQHFDIKEVEVTLRQIPHKFNDSGKYFSINGLEIKYIECTVSYFLEIEAHRLKFELNRHGGRHDIRYEGRIDTDDYLNVTDLVFTNAFREALLMAEDIAENPKVIIDFLDSLKPELPKPKAEAVTDRRIRRMI